MCGVLHELRVHRYKGLLSRRGRRLPAPDGRGTYGLLRSLPGGTRTAAAHGGRIVHRARGRDAAPDRFRLRQSFRAALVSAVVAVRTTARLCGYGDAELRHPGPRLLSARRELGAFGCTGRGGGYRAAGEGRGRTATRYRNRPGSCRCRGTAGKADRRDRRGGGKADG